MEIEFNGMKIGYAQYINFRDICNDSNEHVPNFKLMATPDGFSYVIIYQWANADDPFHKVFNDKEEAFYIDGVDFSNKEMATGIFLDVREGLLQAFASDPNQVFMMEPLVTSVLQKYSNSKAK